MKIKLYIAIALIVFISIAIGLIYVFSRTFESAHGVKLYTVQTDSSTVEIHTNMPIDSVEMLLGKPEKYHTYSVAGSEYHTYEYPINTNGERHGLKLEFKDNKLFSVEEED